MVGRARAVARSGCDGSAASSARSSREDRLLAVKVAAGATGGSDFSPSAIAASLNNLGPGLGDVFSNYTLLETFPKWVCITGMVLGRLEIFALLVLFTRAFWQE